MINGFDLMRYRKHRRRGDQGQQGGEGQTRYDGLGKRHPEAREHAAVFDRPINKVDTEITSQR